MFTSFLLKVQSELSDRGNEYEIIDFIKSRIKMSVGIEIAPKPISVLQEKEEKEEDTKEEEDDDEKDPNVTELPQKVDEFMNFLNRLYFEGELGPDDKDFLKSGFANQEDDSGEFSDNYSDDDPMPPPKLRRKILIST